jgi:hypothetical protein
MNGIFDYPMTQSSAVNGHDIGQISLPPGAYALDQCANKCDIINGCKGFSVAVNNNNVCNLKSSNNTSPNTSYSHYASSQPNSNNFCTGSSNDYALITYNNNNVVMNYLDHELGQIQGTLPMCQQICSSTPNCHGFNIGPDSSNAPNTTLRTCFFKNGWTGTTEQMVSQNHLIPVSTNPSDPSYGFSFYKNTNPCQAEYSPANQPAPSCPSCPSSSSKTPVLWIVLFSITLLILIILIVMKYF